MPAIYDSKCPFCMNKITKGVTDMEIRTLANDEQSFTMLRHIVKNPLHHILINGVPGLGKTHLAVNAAFLYGQAMVHGTSYGKNCVDGMIEKGIWHTKTLHARCLSSIIGTVLKTKKFPLLDPTEQVERERERIKKASAVLNTMYPPTNMGEDATLCAVAHRQSAGHSDAPVLDDVASIQCKVYDKYITILMDAAHTARFGLPRVVGPTNPTTMVTGYLEAGPDVNDFAAWRELAHTKFVDVELSESLSSLDPELIDELFEMLKTKLGRDDFDVHEAVLNDLLEVCPCVFNNMFQFFNNGTITLPNGNVTSRVWMHDDCNGAVVYNHRSLITYQEMMWLTRKLNMKLFHVYIALFYVDEWNDLSPLHLDVLMKIHQDATSIARLCNKPPMQMVFGGDVGQEIYAFQGTLPNPLLSIKTAFAINDINCLIGSKSHRLPDAVIDFTNEFCFRYPDAFLDPHGNVIQLQAVKEGRVGEVRKCVNIETVELPSTVDLSHRERLPEDLKTVVALARNQKDVEEFWQAKVASGEDWMLRLTGSNKTTRSILLEQLKFFERNHMSTLVSMSAWCTSKSHIISHAFYQRKSYQKLLQIATMTDVATVDNVVAALDALIKSKYAHRPSKMATTMHGAKGEEYHIVIVLKPETVPSPRAIQHEHTHPAIYHADLHLVYVTYTRAKEVLLIAETEIEKEEREKKEVADDHLHSSQDTIADAIDTNQPDVLERTTGMKSPMNVRTALDVLELTESPKTLRELSVYVKTKRRHSTLLHNDADGLAEFDKASKMLRRHLLFESNAAGASSLTSLAANVSGGMPGSSAAGASSLTSIAANVSGDMAMALSTNISSNTNADNTNAESHGIASETVLDLLKELQHLSVEQQDIARVWLQEGYSLPVADACALELYKYETYETRLQEAIANDKEFEWQMVLATALGAGAWADDWRERHDAMLMANDAAFAQALANLP